MRRSGYGMPDSRESAVQAAVHKFDGFEAREDWDPTTVIKVVLDATGYEPLIEIILDAAHAAGHIHWRDECNRQYIARALDVPPWLIGLSPRPRFARLRWALRRWWNLPGEETGGRGV